MKRGLVAGGVAWSCPRCDGRTATLSLLRKVLEPATVQEIWTRAGAPDAQEGVRCPSCLKGMRGVLLRVPDGYQELDICQPCTFVWFDAHEYTAMPQLEARGAAADPLLGPVRSPQAIEAVARSKLASLHAKQDSTRATPDAGWKWLPGLMGMPVEFDRSEPASVPVATWVLVGLVSIVSVLSFGDIDAIADRFGFRPSDPWRLGGLTALTAFFLHAGWMHLIGNMYFLWTFGDNSEDVLGLGRYLLLLLLATLAGSILHGLVTTEPSVVAVGASGGISGLIGYYALRFPTMRIGMLFFFIWWLRLNTRVAFALWVGMQLFGAFVVEDNVAYMAHLGGAVVGVAFFALEKLGVWTPSGSVAAQRETRYAGRSDRYEGGAVHSDRYSSRANRK